MQSRVQDLQSAMRALPVPIIGRIDDHALLLDCRCLFDVDEVLRTLDAIVLEGDGASGKIL
jgi:seryl-tRNA(Sec) selenium transferase